MIDLLHWIGSVGGAVAFIGLTSGNRRTRWWGSLGSLVFVFVLLTWATLIGAYGLYVLWGVIACASMRGMWANRRAAEGERTD